MEKKVPPCKYQPRNIEVTCPHCGCEFIYQEWPNIDPVSMPHAIMRITYDGFFDRVCPACGLGDDPFYQVALRDEEHSTVLVLTDCGHLEESKKSLQAIMAEKDELGALKWHDSRLLTDQDVFQEKMRILSRGLDDAVVELLKLGIKEYKMRQDPLYQSFPCRYYSFGDGSELVFKFGNRLLSFREEEIKLPDGSRVTIACDEMAFIDWRLYEEYALWLAQADDSLIRNNVVDEVWANRFYRANAETASSRIRDISWAINCN